MQTKRAFGAGLTPAWAAWAHQHRRAISDGFEYDFVVRVLSKIPAIMPEDVTPQYRFQDHTGRERRIDFVISNRARGLFLALELDGARRGEDELQAQWADFLQRQNDLLELVGPLLRFSNSQMFKNSAGIIERIHKTLNAQANRHKERLLLKREEASLQSKMVAIEKQIAEMQAEAEREKARENESIDAERVTEKISEKIAELNAAHEAAKAKEAEIERSIMEARLAHLTASQNITLAELEEQKTEQNRLRMIMLFAAAILLAMGVVVYHSFSKTAEETPVAKVKSLTKKPIKEAESTVDYGAISGASLLGDDEIRTAHNVAVEQFLSDNADTIVAARGVSAYVGETVTACGVIAGYKAFAKGIYLNIDKPFPKQSVSFVLWDRNLREIEQKIGRISTLVGRDICGKGKVEKYRERYQMSIQSSADIIVD